MKSFYSALFALVLLGNVFGHKAQLQSTRDSKSEGHKQSIAAPTGCDNFAGLTVNPAAILPSIVIHTYFYGNANQTSVTRQQLLTRFINGISDSPWFKTQQEYIGEEPSVVAGTMYVDNSNQFGNSILIGLTQSQEAEILIGAIHKGLLPQPTKNSVYLLVTGEDVLIHDPNIGTPQYTASICREFCAYHSYNSFVGNPLPDAADLAFPLTYIVAPITSCPQGCWIFPFPDFPSTIGDAALQSMFNTLAHEIVELMSDADTLTGYLKFEPSGIVFENGDQCAWIFGTVCPVQSGQANGPVYNAQVGGMKLVIQDNFSMKQNMCVNSGVPSNWGKSNNGSFINGCFDLQFSFSGSDLCNFFA